MIWTFLRPLVWCTFRYGDGIIGSYGDSSGDGNGGGGPYAGAVLHHGYGCGHGNAMGDGYRRFYSGERT